MDARQTFPVSSFSVVCSLVATAICTFSFSLTASAQPPQAAQANGAKQIETLAVVNGKPISRQKIAHESMRRFGEEILEDMVNKMLVLEECTKQGIVITERDVNDEIVATAKKFGLSTERYIETITTSKKISVDEMKNQHVWHMLAIRRLAAANIRVTDQEIDEQIRFEYGASVQVRQIVVNAEDLARKIHAQAVQNPAGFEKLAKQFSIDESTKGMGGLLLPIRQNSGMPEFEKIAFGLQPGEVSPVFPLADVFVILKCEQHFPAQTVPPEQMPLVRKTLEEEISKGKLRTAALDLFDRMQANAKIVNVMNDPQLSQQMPGVAAQVNGRNILIRDVGEDCISRHGPKILDAEITRRVLLDALEKAGAQVAPEDINAEIARAAEAIGHLNPDGTVNVNEWLAYVTNNDEAKVEFYIEDEVWPTVALKKLVASQVDVTQEDMKKGFEANFGPKVEVLAIVCNDQRKALKVWNMASKNPTENYFGKLANQYSIEPASRHNFGVVPPIRKFGGQPELEAEAFSLQRGELSKVVQVGKHWLIMYCLGRTEPVVTDFDAVKEEIYKDILEKKMRMAMSEAFVQLKKDAQIDNFLSGTSQPGKAAVRQARQNQSSPVPFGGRR